MKIAILSRYQNIENRGAETFVFELANELSKKNEVDILSGSRADSLNDVLKGKYQIVIPINGGLQSLKVSSGRLIGGYKMVVSGQAGIGRGEIFNIFITKPDLFVSLTNTMSIWAKKWAWGTKVTKISNGVDLKKFIPSGNKIDLGFKKPIILSVGALEWYKHHEKTIYAMSKLDIGSLLIVGNGPQKDKLESLGNKLLRDRFKIIQSTYKDLPKIYRSANLFVLPSWDREAFGIVYLEAMASGLGVVAPDDSNRREIIGESGILINVSNPKDYSQAIKKALEINWTEKALNQAKKFSWEKIGKEYQDAFEGILK